jgi:hypothetical protein
MTMPLVRLFAVHVALCQLRGVDLGAPSYLEDQLLDELDAEKASISHQPFAIDHQPFPISHSP